MAEVRKPLTILRRKQAQERIGLGRSTLYDRLNPKSPRYDATFPKPIRIGANARAIGFVEAEIEGWLALQLLRREKLA